MGSGKSCYTQENPVYTRDQGNPVTQVVIRTPVSLWLSVITGPVGIIITLPCTF